MKRASLLVTLLVGLSLACGMAVPTQTAAPVFTATPRPIPTYSEPLDYVDTHLVAETCTLVAITDTNLREWASVDAPVVGEILKGEIVVAACNSKWALVVIGRQSGWVCVAALSGNGGCKR